MTYYYERSEIYSFYELSEAQQLSASDELGVDAAGDTMYVVFNSVALPLCNFIRTGSKFIHGVMGLTNTSCYTVTFNRSNDAAIVACRG